MDGNDPYSDRLHAYETALEFCLSAYQQGGNFQTKIAGNGPSIGELVERVLRTGSIRPESSH